MERRPIGETDIDVSPVALGGWPITGITSLDVNETDSVATIRACLDHGINFVDTAYCYGPNGESEKLIRRALGDRRDEMVVATKAGVHWEPDGRQTHDGHPETLVRECEESLRRLGTDHVELLYLHRPDPDVPVAESAGALRGLMEAGKARCIGVSNFGVEHLEAFHPICPISAYQPCYNVLQREIEATTLPWCRARGISVMVYWPLMLGLLAGKLARDHGYVFGRKKTRRKSANGKKRQHPLHPVAVLSVADSGIGMSSDIQSKLFRPFFTTKEDGNGLGLATAKKIIEAQRGRDQRPERTPKRIGVQRDPPGRLITLSHPEERT